MAHQDLIDNSNYESQRSLKTLFLFAHPGAAIAASGATPGGAAAAPGTAAAGAATGGDAVPGTATTPGPITATGATVAATATARAATGGGAASGTAAAPGPTANRLMACYGFWPEGASLWKSSSGGCSTQTAPGWPAP